MEFNKFDNRTPFNDADAAVEEMHHLVQKDRLSYSIVSATRKGEKALYVVPSDFVTEVKILETMRPY
jgi:hypothetical protein